MWQTCTHALGYPCPFCQSDSGVYIPAGCYYVPQIPANLRTYSYANAEAAAEATTQATHWSTQCAATYVVDNKGRTYYASDFEGNADNQFSYCLPEQHLLLPDELAAAQAEEQQQLPPAYFTHETVSVSAAPIQLEQPLPQLPMQLLLKPDDFDCSSAMPITLPTGHVAPEQFMLVPAESQLICCAAAVEPAPEGYTIKQTHSALATSAAHLPSTKQSCIPAMPPPTNDGISHKPKKYRAKEGYLVEEPEDA